MTARATYTDGTVVEYDTALQAFKSVEFQGKLNARDLLHISNEWGKWSFGPSSKNGADSDE